MFIVMELQTNADGQLGNIITTHTDQAEAESKYYQILSYAAVSDVPIHTAMIITSEGLTLKSDCYQHVVQESEVEE